MPCAGEGGKSPVCLSSCKASTLNEDTLFAVAFFAFYPSKKLSQ